MPVRIDAATADDADAVVEMWISLAAGQRVHGSHLAAEDNRKQIRDAVARHIVLDGLRVARLVEEPEATTGYGSEATTGDGSEATTGDGSGAPIVRESRSRPSTKQPGEDDREIVGFVMFDIEAGTYVQDVSRGVIRNLYVRPEYRDAGVGRALLTTAEAALDDAGADVATLEAMADNERAQSFYRDQDYEPHRIEFEKPLGETDQNDTHTRED